ncbi:hypothetical protein CN233_12665 [Sinorhizobium meliloti]|uniref:HEPN domain-containing protein n=1 Tax=Rhizobium meliloti TaxID=382 RepID=UPI000FD9CB6B|nr:HEPN domain-containing protein [Sinorhizobium meliloti]RVG33201.1 hypothetical protein CN233_12665 [Sinorhizobium meliloti]
MSFDIENRFIALEKVINRACAKGLDEEEAAYLCKLGSVLICGNLERCVEIVISSRLAKSPRQVSVFLKSFFKRGTNYDCESICSLLYKFDVEWGRRLEDAIKEEVKASISSCYAVRNSVAHGGGQSLGPKSLKQYFDASLTLVADLQKAVS